MEECKIKNLYNLEETIASKIFEGAEYPWEVLSKIEKFIIELGSTLSLDEYDKVGENVWIAKSAKVAPTAYINGPAIIGKNAEVRHCSKTLCIYKRKSNCWRRCSSWKFDRTKKCYFI